MSEARVLVGVFGAPQGVKGEVRIKSYTGEPRDIGAYGPLTSGDGRRSFTVLSLRPLKDDMLVARIEGVDDRDAAARLTPTPNYSSRATACRRRNPMNSTMSISWACAPRTIKAWRSAGFAAS